MSFESMRPSEFGKLRPRLKMLLEMHRTAATERERATLEDLLADVFLTTAWQVAEDMVQNGWTPVRSQDDVEFESPPRLRLIEGGAK